MIGSMAMQKKTIRITGKRQVTIPQSFFHSVGFGKEAECILRDGEIILRPMREHSDEFSEEILADLIKKGYGGEELLKQFKLEKRKIRPAVEKLLDEASQVAKGSGEYSAYKDVFG